VLQLVRSVVRGLETDAGGGPVSDLAGRLREMRARIEAQAGARDLKRGTGGMVDIEFLTQYLELRHGGRQPALRCPRRRARWSCWATQACCRRRTRCG
jgi:glutamine synthetase adenylyltransferase